MFTVCIYGLGTTVNISSSLCKHPLSVVGKFIPTNIQCLSEFAFFSRNKSNKKDKLSHQSLNIMSSGNAISQNIVSHNHTFRHTGLYKYRIVLTFVKPTCRGGEGQNGWLKCPLGFLVSFY